MYTKIKDPKEYRKQLKNQMDKFTSFTWGPYDMYDEFGMFIINEKEGGLKMYNGPSFSNQYTKAQFSSEGSFLSGINFDIQTLEFTVGVYCFTIAEYRRMLQVLSPYIVDNLTFGFNPEWHYQVKLKNISDSPKYIIGAKELMRKSNSKVKPLSTNTFTEYYYYTELKLVFEIQGTPCLYSNHEYELRVEPDDSYTKRAWRFDTDIMDNFNEADQIIRSDLDFPFDVIVPFKPTKILEESIQENPVSMIIEVQQDTVEIDGHMHEFPPITLLDCQLANLTQLEVKELLADTFYLHYYSESGMVLYSIGDARDTLLTLMSSGSNGKRLVQKLESHKFMFSRDTDLSKCSIVITLKNANFDMSQDKTPNVIFHSAARTNIA